MLPPNLRNENLRRLKALKNDYDPIKGHPSSTHRTLVDTPLLDGASKAWLPNTMLADPEYTKVTNSVDFDRLRFRHDFEYWAIKCVKIRHKLSGETVPFHLNTPQRRTLAQLEEMRLALRPIRAIILKARQWGGSTLVQMYFAWIQTCVKRNWNSLVCAHVKDTASTIRGMYADMLATYPEQYWDGDEKPGFRSWQQSANTREIAGRGSKVTITSAVAQDSVRGLDVSMAHLSEVAFWPDAIKTTADDTLRCVTAGIPLEPCSAIVLESTANGVGNTFHRHWLAAIEKRSSYCPIFVPWYEIEMYRTRINPDDYDDVFRSLDDYEIDLWNNLGLTLEQIKWYHDKRREMVDHQIMKAEYPTTDREAFAATGCSVFRPDDIEQLRPDCAEPKSLQHFDLTNPVHRNLAKIGDLDPKGLKVWQFPAPAKIQYRDRYILAIDIGGRHALSDYTVITVLDRQPDSNNTIPEVVAQWRGHGDLDEIGRYAITLAHAYHQALIVVESNSIDPNAEGEAQFLNHFIHPLYRNLYHRPRPGHHDEEGKWGFHTNRLTKPVLIADLIMAVRNHSYIERDLEMLDELYHYHKNLSGNYCARPGHHDDILMSRAIALHINKIHTKPTPIQNDDLHSLVPS